MGRPASTSWFNRMLLASGWWGGTRQSLPEYFPDKAFHFIAIQLLTFRYRHAAEVCKFYQKLSNKFFK
jgi:hypothetical protein